MSTMVGKAALSALTVALGGLTLAPAEALALEEQCHDEEFWLAYSGYTPVQYTLDNGYTWHSAHTVTPWPGWAVIPGTSYINYNPDWSGTPQAWARYRTTFNVPEVPYGYTLDWDRLYLDVHADNSARAYLDGELVLTQPLAEDVNNFQGAPSRYFTFPFLTEPGPHALEFDVFNFSGPTGLNFYVYYQRRICEPCLDPRQIRCNSSMNPL